MTSHLALSNVYDVQLVAEQLLGIADRLHKNLKNKTSENGNLWPPTDLYRLLTEEYALRARATLLRNDSAAYVVNNATTHQTRLLEILKLASETIERLNRMTELRSIVAIVSTLSTGISPDKGIVVDFLAQKLNEELRSINLT